MFSRTLESFIKDYIEGRRRNGIIRFLLHAAARGFQAVVYLRNFLYDIGCLPVYKIPVCVIDVGGIAAGGTGKTPFVKILAEELSAYKKKPGIIARGYRRAGRGVLCVSVGKGPEVSVSASGDEAYWLALHTKAFVFVAEDRREGSLAAIREGAEIILLEDGMQHRKLHRDLEIVILHGADPFGKGAFLPAGYLRDAPKRLKKADLIVVTHTEEVDCKDRLLHRIRSFSKAPVVGFSSHYSLQENIRGKKIGAFSGIAKPEFFYQALEKLGAEVVETLFCDDHKVPTEKEWQRFLTSCTNKGVECLVCTEKDDVKRESREELPVFALKKEFLCDWNTTYWQEFCQRIGTGDYDRKV